MNEDFQREYDKKLKRQHLKELFDNFEFGATGNLNAEDPNGPVAKAVDIVTDATVPEWEEIETPLAEPKVIPAFPGADELMNTDPNGSI